MNEELVDLVLKQIENPKTVLDIACGTGDLLVKLARRGLAVTGTDISSVALSKAQQTLTEASANAVLIKADFNKKEFAGKFDRIFDLVIIRLSLAFVDDRDIFFEAVKTILSNRGAFIVSTPILLPQHNYDARQSRISINELELETVLRRHFSFVSVLIPDELTRPEWPLRTYLCRK